MNIMEFSEVIAKRHSVRNYTGAEVERELLDRIIDAANTAPSSRNSKSSAFLIVEDNDTLEAISEMRTSGSDFVKDAAAAIVVLGDSEATEMWVENSSISATYILLAATAYGLGSCWVQVRGRLRDKNDASKGTAEEYLRGLLGIKERYSVLCVVALGYEAE
jgi:nitroreductase